jgi:hypothetical protein
MKNLLLVLALVCAGCSPSRFSFENVMRLHAHQTYGEVVDIMGIPDDVEKRSFGNERLEVWATWGDWRFNSTGVHVEFVDGEATFIGAVGIDLPPRKDDP